MQRGDRRQHNRLSLRFSTMLNSPRSEAPILGVTEDLSQDGAFIRTEHWRTLQIDESAIVTLLLPPNFSGQDETIGLEGTAVVSRIDGAKGGVAVQFTKSLKQFERTQKSESL